MNQIRLFLLSSLVIATATTCGLAQQPDEFITLVRNGQSKLTAAEAAFTGYKCEYASTSPRAPKSTSSQPNVARNVDTVARREDRLLLSGEEVSSPQEAKKAATRKNVKLCITDDYVFAISGPANSSGDTTWSLLKFSTDDRAGTFRGALAMHTPVVFPLRALTPKWTINEVIDNPTLSIRSVRQRPDGLVDADFSASMGDNNVTLDGTMTASPSRDYVIVECKYALSALKIYRNTMTRVLSEPGMPTKCMQLKFLTNNVDTGTVEFNEEYSFSDYTTEPQNKAIFTLEHYGIPTPAKALPPIYSRWKFWAIVAVAGLVLALVCRWLARRGNSNRQEA